jgi:hypothetical protein
MHQWGPPMGAPNYAPGPGGPGFAAQPFGANINPAPEMAPSAPSQPTPSPVPNPAAVTVALGKQPEAATSTPPDEAGPNIKSQPVSKKLEDYPDDQLLMVKSNSFSATHPDLNELKNKLVEAGMAFKVALSDVAWWHRIGESKKPTRSWAACFSDPAKQTNFWDMAMARANELANFNIVVEKWDSSKIGGKRSGSKGKPGGAKGYTTARAGTSNTRAAAQDAASSIQDQVAGMPAAAQVALLQTLTAALSKSVAEDKGGKR